MLTWNTTYQPYLKFLGGTWRGRNLTTQQRLGKIRDNAMMFGQLYSQPQGYQSAARALVPTIKTSSFVAAILSGEAVSTFGPLTAIGSMGATVSGEGSVSPTANMGLCLSATVSGEGTVSPGIGALGNISARLDAGAQPSAFDIAQETLGQVIESGVNLKDVLKILLSVAAGKTTITDLGGGNAEVVFRDINDTTDRVTADMSGSERTNVVLDI